MQCRRYSADPGAYHGYGSDSSAHSYRFALNLTDIKILKLSAVGAWWGAVLRCVGRWFDDDNDDVFIKLSGLPGRWFISWVW